MYGITFIKMIFSKTPEWVVNDLIDGMGVQLVMWTSSRRGNSARVTLEADLMKVAEKRMGELVANTFHI